MNNFFKMILLRNRSHDLDALEQNYARNTKLADVKQYQLEKFNQIWKFSQKSIPFYKMWQAKFDLPNKIDSIRTLNSFPLLTKKHINEYEDLIQETPDISRYTLTGGSSGLTTKFPMNAFDAKSAWLNTHLGRRWNNIEYNDKLFMIWGHSHLFSGRYARLKQAKRKFKDFILGIKRVSAYDMSLKNLENIYLNICQYSPNYIIGYGSCLTLLANYIEKSGYNNLPGNLKCIVNTSEPIVEIDAALLTKIFSCPVINEYGMAEAGVIGYSILQRSPIHIMWRDYILSRKNQELILTTIGERCFPLINYSTEDYSDGIDEDSMTKLDAVEGKVRAVMTISIKKSRKAQISVVLLDHILKQIPAISQIHYEQVSDGKVKVMYTCSEQIKDADIFEYLKQNLAKEGMDILPDTFIFHNIQSSLTTIAGKRVVIINNNHN